MKPLHLALLQYEIRPDPAGVSAFAARLDHEVAQAAAAGAELAVLPEYACVEAGAGPTADLDAELHAVVSQSKAILAAMRATAMRHRIWLLPGTLPHRHPDGRIHNIAPLIAPDGRMAIQQKRVMTRFESEHWNIAPGAEPGIAETPWGRIGIAICYDVEFPALVRAQVQAGAWLILAPSCTDTIAGFNRVRLSARARALENQCYVAITPTVGAAPSLGTLDVNRGYAAVYTPVDRGFPEDGVLARGPLDAHGWVHAILDPARLQAVRADGGVRNHRDWPANPAPARLLAFE